MDTSDKKTIFSINPDIDICENKTTNESKNEVNINETIPLTTEISEKEETKSRDKICLKGKIKKFSKKLYDRYDIPARELLKDKLGNLVRDNPDIYAEDLILDDPECRYKFIELQVSANWKTENYPYKLPFVYERKGHFSKNTIFILLNRYMTRGLLFDKESLNLEPKRIKKYSRTFIYDVPWNKVLPFFTHHLDIDLVRSY